ncbi:MAG: cold shock domain-containing protein [Alistipes sp.]|nr:cold shock domain-containing protein [Alistipes sp.]
MIGRVKWFDNRKGYGFIRNDAGEEVYVHYTALVGDGFRGLKHNQQVEFETITTDSGKVEARNVIILK